MHIPIKDNKMDNTLPKTVYQVFVASTLRIKEHRAAVKSAIKEANADSRTKDKSIWFEEFLYENRPDVMQKLEKRDAQEPADRFLRRSPIFILVIDDVVRDLTRYEFELALERFDNGQMPRYIFLCHKKDKCELAEKTNSDGLSYEEFFNMYNLNSYKSDKYGGTIVHRRVYDLPYDGLEDGPESLKMMVNGQLMRLIESDEMAFPHAVMGWQLDNSCFFGNDPQRMEKCPNVYYRRQVDYDLDLALKTDCVVLLVGESLTGKTRAAMEALKTVDDGWVYVPDKGGLGRKPTVENQVATIESLVRYFSQENPQKLYVFFDDIGFLAHSDERVNKALNDLVKAIQVAHGKGVLLATSSTPDVGLEGLSKGVNGVCELHIGTMTDSDLDMAVRYFVSCGYAIDHDSLRYKMMGALFVDLGQLRTRYKNYLHGSDLSSFMKNDVKDLYCNVRRLLLQAIKAQSIWRDDRLGDLDMLNEMVRYLFSGSPYSGNVSDKLLNDVFASAVEMLCREGALGVTKGNSRMLDIQEYVYKYFVGYDGEILDKPYEEKAGVKAERNAVNDIIMFCGSKEYYSVEEPLTWNVSRVSSRCVYNTANVDWLYSLWSGKTPVHEAGEYGILAELLQANRYHCETMQDEEITPKTRHHFSKMVEVYIYRCCCSFEESFMAYESCASSMRTDHLLCALMRKASSIVDRERVRAHADYERFRNDPYVIRSEVEWAETFDEAAAIMARFNTSETPDHVIDRILGSVELQYDLIQLTGAASTVFSKIATEEDFDRCIGLLQSYYVKIIDDPSRLKYIKENGIKRILEGLTIIDIMARIKPFLLEQGLMKVFGGNMDASRSLVEKMKSAVKATLQTQVTSETEVRVLLGVVGSWLVKWAANEGCSYDEVYNTLFIALQMPHPLKDGEALIMRNSYTYTAMMMCGDCEIEKAMNLFENDLVSHVADRNNPIVVNQYTLNTLLKKCRKKPSAYLRRVSKLFRQIGVKRDAFSYYSILKGSKYNDEGEKDYGVDMATCKAIIKEMQEDGVKHNVFTITALMSSKDVDLAMALGFMDCPAEVLSENYQTKTFPGFTMPNELKAVIKSYDEAWSNVFRKKCPTQVEKDLLGRCLEYIEKTYGNNILCSGKVYNAIVSNNDFMPDIASAIAFLREKMNQGLFFPDSFTACILLDKVANEKGKAKRGALYLFNNFLKENLGLIDTYVVNKRINIYKSHNEQLPQVFVDANGNIIESEMVAMKYVETMQELGFKIEYFTVKEITRYAIVAGKENAGNSDVVVKEIPGDSIGGLSDALKSRLMKVLIKQQKKYPTDSQMSETLRERIGDEVLGKYKDLRLVPESVLSHNKNVTNRFKRKAIDINTALTLLNWSDANSAGIEFNTIMTHYINGIEHKDEAFFQGVMSYYRMFYGSGCGRRPSSYTFGVIVKAVSSINDFKTVMMELLDKRKADPRLSLQPVMLARLAAVVRCVKDLTIETCKFKEAGGEYDRNTADVYLYKLACYIYNTDKEHTQAVLDDVFRYIILGGDAKSSLVLNEREHLLMDVYADIANVQPNTLHTIIKYNRRLTIPMDDKEIVDGIRKRYPKCIPELMNLLAREGGWMVKKYLFPLFSVLEPHSSPRLDNSVLIILATSLPQYNISAYNYFVRQLYLTDCRDVEAAVPGLVKCIHRISKKEVDNVELLKAVHRTEAQMFTYAELGILRCGHLLIEKAPAEYGDWCRHTLQSDLVYQRLCNIGALNKDRVNLADKLKYSISLLEDAFPCALMVLGKQHDDIPSDAKVGEIMDLLQEKYTTKIAKGKLDFQKLQRLPLLWQRASWVPSVEHVLALVSAYVRMLDDDYYFERIEAIIEGLVVSVVAAENRHAKEVLVRYGTIGYFKYENRIGRKVPIGELSAILYKPIIAIMTSHRKDSSGYSSRQKYGFLTVERNFARYLDGVGRIDYRTLVGMPQLWIEARLLPSTEMVLAMVKFYKKVAMTEKPNAKDARLRVNQIRHQIKYAINNNFSKVRIPYAVLGKCEAGCTEFVLVDIDKLAPRTAH